MKTCYKTLTLLILLLFKTQLIYPQWVQTNGPYGGIIHCLAVSDTNIFAGSLNGIYRSTNNGISWMQTGLTNLDIISLAVSGNKIFAGTSSDGVYISTNNGTNWTQSSLTSEVFTFAVSEANIFAGSWNGLYLSTNNGTNWTQVAITVVNALAISGINIFAGINWPDGCVYLSTNNGTNWTKVNNGLPSFYYGVNALATIGNNVFAGTDFGIYLSTNNGTNWTQTGPIEDVLCFTVSGTNIYAGTSYGVYLSTNNGNDWVKVSNGLPNSLINSLATIGINIFAGTNYGIYLSANNGINWTLVNYGLINTYIYALAVSGTNIFAGTKYGIYLSTDKGNNWIQTGPIENVLCFTVSGTNVYAGTNYGVYLSTNNGTSWALIKNYHRVTALTVSGTNIFASTYSVYYGSSIFLSTNNGTDWTEVNNGLQGSYYGVNALAVSGTNIFAGTDGGGVYRSTNNGTNWSQVYYGSTKTYIYSLAVSGTKIFAGTPVGVYLSTNNGTNWTQINNGLTITDARCLAVSGTNIFVGTADGVFLSKDNGTNWTQAGLNNLSILSLALNETDIFAGTDGASVWKRPLAEFVLSHPSITITSPNGGEVWEGVTVHNITWLEENNLSNIKVDFSIDAGSTWINLSTVPPGKGTYNWTVPPFPCTTTKTRVSSVDFPQYNSQSTQNFTLTTNPSPAVFVSSPNGGNKFKIGSIQNITWAASQDVSYLNIELTTDNGATWTPVANNIPASPNTYSWTVPNTPSTSCKIRLTYANVNTVYDVSDSVFVMENMNLTSPNGGEACKSGISKDIIFTASVPFINIKYSTDNGASWNDIVNNSSSAPGTFSWPVPSISSTQCLIRISDASDSTFFDVSDNPFVIWQVIALNQTPVINQNHLSFGSTNILLDMWVFTPAQITLTFFGYETPQTGTLPSGVNNVSQYYWTMSADGITFLNGYIRAPLSSLRGVNNTANLVWLKRTNPGDAWTNIGGIITDGNLVNTVAFTSLSEFAVGSSGIDPLPVQLVNFSAKQDQGTVFLKWETKTEIQNAGFDIERKTVMDKQFNKVGFIKGIGNSNAPNRYSFSDNKNQGGKSSYRLRQINTDGLFTYSNEIEVNIIPSEYTLYQNYPNPFNPSTVIKYAIKLESNVNINFFNSLGQCVREVKAGTLLPGYYELNFNSTGLASGIYIYSIKAVSIDGKNNFTAVKKMVILK